MTSAILNPTPVPEQLIVHVDGHRIGNVHMLLDGKHRGRWVCSDAVGRHILTDQTFTTPQDAADAMLAGDA